MGREEQAKWHSKDTGKQIHIMGHAAGPVTCFLQEVQGTGDERQGRRESKEKKKAGREMEEEKGQ